MQDYQAPSAPVSDQAREPRVERFNCPGCGEAVEAVEVADKTVGQLVRCAYCNADFFASAENIGSTIVDDTRIDGETDRDSEINKLRIAQYAALRRGAIRARSWWVITWWMCLFVVLDGVGQIFLYVRTWHRWGVAPTACIGLMLAAILFAFYANRRASDFHREIVTSALSEPTLPPDFSTLGDGSDLLKHLEEIR